MRDWATSRPGRWSRRLGGLLAAGSIAFAAACSGPAVADGHHGHAAPKPSPPARVQITPADGADHVRPDYPVKVAVTHGIIEKIHVRSPDGGPKVSGELGHAGATWTSTRTLLPSATYTVKVTAVGGDGRTTTATSRFTTLTPKVTNDVALINPGDDQTVGVGMPIVVTFDRPVYDKANVERAFEVRASRPVVGAWHWVSRYEVHFRPKHYWPAGDKVYFIANLAGVRTAKGVYATEDHSVRFRVGPRHVTVVHAKSHRMTVYAGGHVVRRAPVSTGKPGDQTKSGTMVAFQKAPVVIMDSATVGIPKGSPGYYRLTVYWDVKFTDSGEYIHDAPWSLGAQGHVNVSHGCVNASPKVAKWYYHFTNIGDIITVEGTSVHVEPGNGWTDWDASWHDLLQKSATGPRHTTPLVPPTPSPPPHQVHG